MRHSNLKGVLLQLTLMSLCAVMVMPASAGWAQESEFNLPDFYPESFSGYGCIDSIDSDGVVIDDRLMRFSMSATFHTPEEQKANWLRFEPGYLAGYIRNADKEIDSLWYIKPCSR